MRLYRKADAEMFNDSGCDEAMEMEAPSFRVTVSPT